MKKTLLAGLLIFGLVSVFAVVLGSSPASAALPADIAPQYTPIATPTAGPDGRIIYIVLDGDTLWRISAITGVSLEELRRLNNLTEADVIKPGDRLLLGLGGPADIQPTEGPEPTPLVRQPTPTPAEIGTGIICVSVFLDLDGDGMRQDAEVDLEGSAINIGNRLGTVSLSQEDGGGLVPRCYEDVVLGYYDIEGSRQECLSIVMCAIDLEAGEYNVSVAVPDGYNATTKLNHVTELDAGYQRFIDFGAQANSETSAEVPIIPDPEAPEETRSPVLAIVGGGLLVIGVGLAVFALLLRRPRQGSQ